MRGSDGGDKLKLVAVDNGEGCVAPTAETIEDGSYAPLSRPLFIYVSTKSLERPVVKAFVEFYMEHGRDLVREVGYIPLPPDAYLNTLTEVKGFKSGS